MVNSEKVIVDDILKQMERYSSGFHNWYVGITEDIEEELFKAHQVKKTAKAYIIRKAISLASARSLESHFLNLGCEGCKCEKKANAVYVYAYKKTDSTLQ